VIEEAAAVDGGEVEFLIDGLSVANWTREVVEEMIRARIVCVHATCAVWEDAADTLRQLGRWRRFFDANQDVVTQATDGSAIRAAAEQGLLAVVLGFQNTSPLGSDLDLVRTFYDLGVRIMQLTYNNQSLVASGCYEAVDGGVTRFGREVIREMNKVGVLIDLSHVGDRSAFEATEMSARPVAITHANPKWFNNVSRNRSSTVIDLVAARGGVIGVCPYTMLLPGASSEKLRSDCSLDQFCDMIIRLAGQVGIASVGIGSDLALDQSLGYFQWLRMGTWTREVSPTVPPVLPEWARRPHHLRAIAERLLTRGLGPQEVAAISYGNWLRLFDESFRPWGRRTEVIETLT
jgi:microsomal dipeptidase-like Zn-dependent dipeptidase